MQASRSACSGSRLGRAAIVRRGAIGARPAPATVNRQERRVDRSLGSTAELGQCPAGLLLSRTREPVVDQLPPAISERVARRWQGRPPRAIGGDRLLRIPPAVYVEDLLGARPGRNGKVCCPFHRDERPSLHVYPTSAR